MKKEIDPLARVKKLERVIAQRKNPYRLLNGKGPYVIEGRRVYEGSEDAEDDLAIAEKRSKIADDTKKHLENVLEPRLDMYNALYIKTRIEGLKESIRILENNKSKLIKAEVLYWHKQILYGLEDTYKSDKGILRGRRLLLKKQKRK